MGLKYKDFGKKAGDTLGDDYYSYDRSLEVSTKTSNGTSFKVEGGTDGKDGPISAKFTGGFKAYGLDFKKVSVDSGSRIGVETKFAGVMDGLTLTAVIDTGFGGDFKKRTIKADYSTSGLTVNAEVDTLKSAVTTYASFGVGDISLGGMAKFQGELKDYNAAFAFDGGDFTLSGATTKSLSGVNVGYFQKLGNDTDLGATVSAALADPAAASLEVGCVYTVDANSKIASKINSGGVLSLGCNQAITSGITLGASAEINAARFESDDHKLGLSLTFE